MSSVVQGKMRGTFPLQLLSTHKHASITNNPPTKRAKDELLHCFKTFQGSSDILPNSFCILYASHIMCMYAFVFPRSNNNLKTMVEAGKTPIKIVNPWLKCIALLVWPSYCMYAFILFPTANSIIH